jgi:RNA polymerase sigma-70 factor, ECF subfamily
MVPSFSDDKELVGRYLNGDKQAFSRLVERYQSLVYNLCFRLVGSVHEAEDLTQDIFVRLLDKVSSWRAEAKFSTWLYRLALNHCRDHLRRRSWPLEEAPDQLIDPAPGPDMMIEDQEAGRAVFQALLQLPMEFRSVVFLRDVEGFSYREIADILDIRPGTVKSRLARGRARLVELLRPAKAAAKSREQSEAPDRHRVR